MATRVYVGDLGDNGSQQELEDTFKQFGSLKEVWIAKDPKGFAFVEFNYAEDASTAIKQLDNTIVCGCKVRVEMARDSRRGRGGRGGRGFYPRTSYRQSSPYSYGGRSRRDDRGPRGSSFRDRDVGYSDRDYRSGGGGGGGDYGSRGDTYIGSRRDVYTPPPSRGDMHRGRSDYEGPRGADPYYETSTYRSGGGSGGIGGSYGRSVGAYENRSREYSPPRGGRDEYSYSSGPRGYVGAAPSFRDEQHSSYDYDRNYSRRDDYYGGGGSVRNGDRSRYGRSPMRSPKRSFRDRSPY
ncbi:Serine/arginine-rich splicing factor 3-like [Oopsacas minuta]|uniref:Serine/arginine-rich splicing factor 3-like n=1 Tax=Oopsacas minuta TaxID=111878 RepID=A0AAV7JW44_9METZ|nr:Serine/arginine-rich splicing factor 3-like [Oopsacas minuta]